MITEPDNAAHLPTGTAVSLAHSCGLVDVADDKELYMYKSGMEFKIQNFDRIKSKNLNQKEINDFVVEQSESLERLARFQEVAYTGEFETALIAGYHSFSLTDDQKAILEIIHKYTRDWSIGYLTSTLMKHIGDKRYSGKDKASMVEAISKIMNGEDPEKIKANGQAAGVIKSFYMELNGEG